MDYACGARNDKCGTSDAGRDCSCYLYKTARNQEVALSVLMKIADVLDCDAGDILSFVKETSTMTKLD